jgi:hypothetical protein
MIVRRRAPRSVPRLNSSAPTSSHQRRKWTWYENRKMAMKAVNQEKSTGW